MPSFQCGAFMACDQPASAVPACAPEPLLVYLHGIGEIGGESPWADINSLEGGYHPDAITAMRRFRVLGLHLAAGDWDSVQEVDPARVSLTGVSRGGRGVLQVAIHRRQIGQPVRSVAAFCPEGGNQYDQQQIALLRRVPIYFFHAPKDPTVGFDGTQALQNTIGDASCRLRLIKPGERHQLGSEAVSFCCRRALGFPSQPLPTCRRG
jgi:dienelactone hydrolase